MSIYTIDNAQIKPHTLVFGARLNAYVNETANVTINITKRCTPNKLNPPVMVLSHIYQIGNPALIIPILPFLPDIVCPNDYIIYEGALSKGGSGGSSIKYLKESNAITV